MSFEYSQEVSNDYEKLFETEKGYDVIIYAGENNILKEFRAHSLILCARSRYFCAAFTNEWVEKRNEKFIFKKPNISPELFKIILRFIYCGKIDLTKLRGPELLSLLTIADELNIQTLISCIQKYLIINRDEFLQKNLVEILQITYQHEPFADLLNYCLKNFEMMFDSNIFIDLEASLLEFLLRQDNLNLDKTFLWNNLIKWGLAQNPHISQDITRLNDNEISIMEKTLQKFVPLIGLCNISSDDFLNPLKRSLPKELVDNFFTFIELQHFAIFSSLIDKKGTFNYDVKVMPYNFRLLYRASIDGNTAEAFHKKCDNKGATLVIVKFKNSEQIVGGYNPFEWDSSGYKSTKDGFIFSFKNRMNLQTAKVSYSKGDKYSVGCHSTIFGYNDLYYYNYTWYGCNSKSYSKIDDMPTGKLNVYDYEVFQVIKKKQDGYKPFEINLSSLFSNIYN
ncbi:hypothetical protein C1645_877422 [Glomus cerebriforme]|uniref:BTB/POZ domain-containing protein n=1 Tax=Glomus cerebriforme TaxID=658196 RepID=A0A397SQF4_9GLOM|nr:hypothetical protein C1645_877422 [Glomus cerebriforme]